MKDKLFHFDNTYEKLPQIFYTKVKPNPVSRPAFVYINEDLAKDLGLSLEKLKVKGLDILAGNELPEDASSIAQAYMGHQFGHPAILGDGRALLVGEILDPQGKRYDIQLKGSGPTSYSRGGDGRATLYYMLKEYLFSEAMHYLNIPSSRSLAVVRTGDEVYRSAPNEGAILTRVASSHLRVGTLQFARWQDNLDDLRLLVDYAIQRHYPEIADQEDKYLAFYDRVLQVQAQTVAKWMAVGFIHGVMNTDNTSISGETFDYGPCAFMDTYDPDTVFSSIDSGGRYRYGNQPRILFWNLARLGESILPLVDPNESKALEMLNSTLGQVHDYYDQAYYTEMTQKLGLSSYDEADQALVDDLLKFMESHKLDFTNTFVDLRRQDFTKDIYQEADFQAWKKNWENRLAVQGESPDQVQALMASKNPIIIARNYWVQASLEQADQGDFSLLDEFLEELKKPFADNPEKEKFRDGKGLVSYTTYCGT